MWKKTSEYTASLLESCITHKSLNAGKLLHAYIIRTGLFSHTYLSNRLIDFYSKCYHLTYAHHVFDVMPKRDVFSWNAMLSALCAGNRWHDAHTLFDEMPERNVVSWNNMISGFVKRGECGRGLDLYVSMISEGFVPTRFTFASVFSACGVLLEGHFGRVCHGLAIKVGVDKNMYVGNAVLTMYARCGCLDDAWNAFAELPEPNEVSFTALMCGLAESQRVEEALRVFKLMHRSRVCIDAVSLSSILSVCAGGRDHGLSYKMQGRLVHGLSVKLGLENDLHLSNSLLDMYAKSGNMDSAEIIFQNLAELNVVSWNIMIAGYGQIYNFEKAMELIERMEFSGCQPDEVTFINILAGCVNSGNVVVGRQLFDKMRCPSLSSWNGMLSGYSQIGKHDEAIMVFRNMQFRNIKPDRTTLAIVLGSCAEMGLQDCGEQVHTVSIKASMSFDVFVGSALITLYSKIGKMDTAQSIFLGLPEVDIVCWNAMIAGFSHNSLGEEAFDFFNIMRRRNMSPTQFSYATLLSCCAKQCFSSQGRQIHGQTVKDGFIYDIFVGSALIDMYCKCGNVLGAQELFDAMPVKNTVIWNEMILGYAQNGSGAEAMHLYKCMIRAGEKPDDVTFTAVLTACSHSGLVDDGVRLFESMQLEHGVEPLLDHFTCIIDALGRAGRLREAEFLIKKMPCKDDPVIWEVLLSSCRVYSNLIVAKRAAEKLFSLNPSCSTPYVLLGNIYSSMGGWEEARVVRELMTDKDMGKDAGYSWAETMNTSGTSEVFDSYFSQSQWS